MPSLSARATAPVVKIIGKRLAAANTPEQLRDEFALSARLLMPSLGVTRKEVRLDGLRAVRVSTDAADTSDRAILLFHGGGYVFGSPSRHASLGGRYAKAAGAPVYIPEYRLAPEHPCPGAAEDGLRAHKAMLERYPSEKIALAGDSAGGGLCVATLQAARAEGLPMPSSLLLLSPWLDVSGASESMETNRDSEILILPETFARCARWHAGGKDMTDPVVSPISGQNVQMIQSAKCPLFSGSCWPRHPPCPSSGGTSLRTDTALNQGDRYNQAESRMTAAASAEVVHSKSYHPRMRKFEAFRA